jgi:hypothetical protein
MGKGHSCSVLITAKQSASHPHSPQRKNNFPTRHRLWPILAMPSRPPTKAAHCRRRRPGWFRPVPLRARADGWSEARQCGFLGALYATGSVAAAAKAVGMTRASAYRLRARQGAESFAAMWDRVLTPPGCGHVAKPRPDFRKVTLQTLTAWVETGFVQPVIYRGRMCGIRRKPDDSTLLRLVRRLGDDPEPSPGETDAGWWDCS